MKFKKCLFVLITLIASQFTTAQLTGKIIEADERYPLQYATVALYQTNNKALVTGVVTNFDGLFSFADVKPGNYYIEASFMGYQIKIIKAIIMNKKGEKKDVGTLTLVLGSG
jgi:iron complex outermembrane receptor protein